MSVNLDAGTFTVGVFKDAPAAVAGVGALAKHGLTPDVCSFIAKDTPENAAWLAEVLGQAAGCREVAGLGAVLAAGSLLDALDGPAGDLARTGLAGTMHRAGFQPHDGQIYQTLAERGGVLVAVESESRAADAISVFLAYGAGNAAIGAWRGRV